jgi:cytochrome c biogenesis protein CcmG/thiol:disulfide interchange protein DsbE
VKRFLLVAILASVLGLFVWALTRPASDQALASPLVGRAAPVFDIPLYAADSTLSLAALRGRPVVLNFWASWCLACRDEAAVLEAGWQEYGSDVAFVGVAVDDESSAARAFIARYGKTYYLGPDVDGAISVDYGLFGVPETFFIGTDGRILAKHVGPLSQSDLARRVEEIRAGRVGGESGSLDGLTPLEAAPGNP